MNDEWAQEIRFHNAVHEWARRRGEATGDPVLIESIEWTERAGTCSADTCDLEGVIINWYDGHISTVTEVSFAKFITEIAAIAAEGDGSLHP